jgi:hypothetical protein
MAQDDAAFYEEIAAELLATAMACIDPLTRDKLIKLANAITDRLERTHSAAK